MTTDSEIFADALDLPAAERDAFLITRCSGDLARVERIKGLLRAHAKAELTLAVPLATRPVVIETQAGTVIGHYKLLEKIGEGGCGIVWMAQQEVPVRRRVALKVIKLGMDTREVIARFEAERQALAMMEHPNIAKVLEAGATEIGRPYFVMELVRGQPITTYCDERKLTTGQRLALFAQVCRAIHHAHEKGIVHRDIKPSNILIDDEAIWLCDLGLAIAIGDDHDLTGDDLVMGTPLYMSPEQACGSRQLTPKSDIYSLGVTMYFTVTGKVPFDGTTAIDVMRQHVTQQPLTIRSQRNDLSELLDQLIMRMLAKKVEDRPSARDLEAEVNRALKQLHDPLLNQAPRATTSIPLVPDMIMARPNESLGRSGSRSLARRNTTVRRSAGTGTAAVTRSAIAARAHEQPPTQPAPLAPAVDPRHYIAATAVVMGVALCVYLIGSTLRGGQASSDASQVSPTSKLHSSVTSSAISQVASASPASASIATSQSSSSAKPVVSWLSYQHLETAGDGQRLHLGGESFSENSSWKALSCDGKLVTETGEPVTAPQVEVPLTVEQRQALADLDQRMVANQVYAIEMAAGHGVLLPVRFVGLRALVASFVRVNPAIDDWSSLILIIGDLAVEIGRVAGDQRFHRFAAIAGDRLDELARSPLDLTYLDAEDSVHIVQLLVEGRTIHLDITAGSQHWALRIERERLNGRLGAVASGRRGAIRWIGMTLEADHFISTE
jgi:serine/threonine protein kinase